MNFISKRMILKNPTKHKMFKNDILKSNTNNLELSLSNIHKNKEEMDKDKITLENINYIEKDIFTQKPSAKKNSSFISKNDNISNKELNPPSIIKKDNLFGNKIIRNLNKIKNIQISIFEQEISMKNLLTAKRNKFMENKYQVIKDDKNDTINNKNKILNIIRTQTKSNFNNKYRLKFKSSNKKKRNVIQNYFSLIKKDMKFDNGHINTTGRKLYSFNNNNFRELSFKRYPRAKINKDILLNINTSHISDKTKKVVFIPLLNPNRKPKKYFKTKF